MAKKVDKKARAKEIAYSALSVIADRGVDQTSMNDIAKATGIAKGTLYEYFSSKDELIRKAINYGLEEYAEYLKQYNEINIPDPEKRFRVSVEKTLIDWVDDKSMDEIYLACFQVLLSRKTKKNHKRKIIKNTISFFGFYVETLNEGIDKGIFKTSIRDRVDEIVMNFIVFFDGLYIYYLADKKSIKLKKQMDAYLDIMFDGIRNHKDGK